MSAHNADLQQQIFNQELDDNEKNMLSSMMSQSKKNLVATQQLAIDASHLITQTEERLKSQTQAGFFKRFANAVSGKNSEYQLQNQSDVIQMQKIGWHYLKTLQQQNLIQAQSIAIIRNNLGTISEYVIETRDFLELAINRFDHRLTQVENSTGLSQWALNIEANKRRFKSYPKNLLVLYLTYDFIRSNQKAIISGTDFNTLIVTLESLGVNCDEEIRFLDFITQLIDDIDVSGIERYREMVTISFDDQFIDTDFILKNISGVAFNAFYFLSSQYEKIIDLLSDSTIYNDDEARAKFISKFFGHQFSGLTSTYNIRNLIGEIAGGSLVAIELYKAEHGLNVIEEAELEEQSEEFISLVSSLPNIKTHTFFDSETDPAAKAAYVKLFALCFAESRELSKTGKEFLTLLAEKAGCATTASTLASVIDNNSKFQEYLSVMEELLQNEDHKYCWLADAFYLLTLCQISPDNSQMHRIIGTLRPNEFKECFPKLIMLITDDEPHRVLEAIKYLISKTWGWKNIIHYREIRFDACFADVEKQLRTTSFTASNLWSALMDASRKASEYGFFFTGFDDGLLSKATTKVGSSVYTLGRRSATSSLNGCRKEVHDFITNNQSALYRVNALFSGWNIAEVSIEVNIAYKDYELDNSATNDNWHSQFNAYYDQVYCALSNFSQACSDALAQIEHFKKGEFDQSVVKIKEQQIQTLLEKQQQEKIAKQSVAFAANGVEKKVSITWSLVKHPPCDPEKVRLIKTDGKLWLLQDDSENLYRSEDGQSWHSVPKEVFGDSLCIRKIIFTNGTWIILSGYSNDFFYSTDGLSWHKSHEVTFPNRYGFSSTDDIIFFNGVWLWRFTQYKEYDYTEKGFLFDSKKTYSYSASTYFATSDLSTDWSPWDIPHASGFGIKTDSIYALPGINCLLAIQQYDYTYAKINAILDNKPFVNYLTPGKDWRDCTWGSKETFFGNAIFTRWREKLMCFYGSEYLMSEKGYDWKKHNTELRVKEAFDCEDFMLFSSSYSNERIWLSADCEHFAELILGEGHWQHLSATSKGVLCVFSPDQHETFLKFGRFIRS
ncbi:hypothetical protein [Pantoea piersonii]|uniref:hypothetical protein n=1 Tax=Pantoea piersonii TaxID=2364647 RepID=UPI0028B157D4|nr:hypothetical protein [Pantoea piersonii]